MVESKTVTVVPLKGKNYPTWKVQCKMALMKDNLWGIVDKTETAPGTDQAEKRAKFMARKDHALVTIVLSIDPSLLYLIGQPKDPIDVWKKLEDQFQKKTWANKLALRRKLYSQQLQEGDSVQEHIEALTEIFDGLAAMEAAISEEDQVVHLLASLPESYNMLVTALEANAEVSKWETVTERLLHEERKSKERTGSVASGEKAMFTRRFKKRGPKCRRCGEFSHIKRNCRKPEKKTHSNARERETDSKPKVNKAEVMSQEFSDSGSDSESALMAYLLTANGTNDWIVDSGSTCHMCGSEKLFVKVNNLEQPLEVTLGDGRKLNATGRGKVRLKMKLPGGKTRICNLQNVLYVPKLSYNLLSVSKATKSGKTTRFDQSGCQILETNGKLVAVATRVGSLYHLDCESCPEEANTTEVRTTNDQLLLGQFLEVPFT